MPTKPPGPDFDNAQFLAEWLLLKARAVQILTLGLQSTLTPAQRMEFLDEATQVSLRVAELQAQLVAWLAASHAANPDVDPFAPAVVRTGTRATTTAA